MRACKVKINTELLFKELGLKDVSSLDVVQARINDDRKTLTLYIQSDSHPDLPEVETGEEYPTGEIILHTCSCGKTEANIFVRERRSDAVEDSQKCDCPLCKIDDPDVNEFVRKLDQLLLGVQNNFGHPIGIMNERRGD